MAHCRQRGWVQGHVPSSARCDQRLRTQRSSAQVQEPANASYVSPNHGIEQEKLSPHDFHVVLGCRNVVGCHCACHVSIIAQVRHGEVWVMVVGSALPTARSADPTTIVVVHLLGQMDSTQFLAAANPCSRSARMSSMNSMPTASRTRPGVTPDASWSSGESCAWVVDAGWMTNERTSPILATWL